MGVDDEGAAEAKLLQSLHSRSAELATLLEECSRFFLEMAARYATARECPSPLPSGYAALLYLYDLR